MTNPAFYWIFLVLCSAYVLIRGAAPERVAITIAIVASILSVPSLFGAVVKFQHMAFQIFVVDVVTLIAFLMLALCADRYWPIWITGIHLIGVATHAAKLIDPRVIPWAYAVTQALWSYPILLLVVIGTQRHQDRLRRFGADKSWNASFIVAGLRRLPLGPNGWSRNMARFRRR